LSSPFRKSNEREEEYRVCISVIADAAWMLFHSLYAPESGVYCTQLSCVLEGDLNLSAFEQAWQRVVDIHPILRTAFVWEGLERPVQVVASGAA
jgi:hypothetical protein